MVTAIALVFGVLMFLALGFMFVEMCRGNFCAWFWWMTGGAGVAVEFLGACVVAVFEGLSGN